MWSWVQCNRSAPFFGCFSHATVVARLLLPSHAPLGTRPTQRPFRGLGVVVDQKGISAEFLPKVSAEIRQKVFLHLFGLSVLLQKHFLSAECQSFCRNCSFLQLESCFEGSMVLHLSWNSYKFPFLHPILCKILHSKELLTCRKNLFLQKDAISAERPSFGSFCISAERNIFGRLSFCFLQNDKIPLSVDH